MPLRKVTFTATFTPQDFPGGTVAGNTVATLSASGTPIVPAQNLDAAGVAVFLNVPDGTYTLTVQTFDAQGNALGAAYSAAVAVAVPDVSISIVSGGTIAIV